jgi:hypothetical protein
MIKRVRVLREPMEFPCDFFLWGVHACCMKDFVYSILIDTIEVLNEQVGNAATIIRNNRGMLGRVEELFHPRLHFCN